MENKPTISGDEPYYPTFTDLKYNEQFQTTDGITIRQKFAADIQLSPDEPSINQAKLLMKTDAPSGLEENQAWWTEAEAKLRVQKADALIKALNQPAPFDPYKKETKRVLATAVLIIDHKMKDNEAFTISNGTIVTKEEVINDLTKQIGL